MSLRYLANVLSGSRLVLTLVGCTLIALNTPGLWWFVALGCIGLAVPTEPLDGWAARKFGSSPAGKWINEIASGALCILFPSTLLGRFIIGYRHGWPEATQHTLIFWSVWCGIFLVGTLVFMRARAVLVPYRAEKWEVTQAWFTGLIIALSALQIFWPAFVMTGHFATPLIQLAMFGVVFAFAALTFALTGDGRRWKRRNERQNGAYKGTKQHLILKG